MLRVSTGDTDLLDLLLAAKMLTNPNNIIALMSRLQLRPEKIFSERLNHDLGLCYVISEDGSLDQLQAWVSHFKSGRVLVVCSIIGDCDEGKGT